MMPLLQRMGMVERIAAILLLAVLVELVASLALYHWQERQLISAGQATAVASRLSEAVEIATRAPPADRARLLRRLALSGARFNWVPHTVITDASEVERPLSSMRQRLHAAAPQLAHREMRLTLVPSDGVRNQDMVGTLRLDDGSFVSFRVLHFMGAAPGPLQVAALHVLIITIIFALALFSVKAAIRPLRDLALAADETARNHAAPITPSGPHEVRRVATAFAAMQARLLSTMEEHARALISVSHDLRTPIQRLHLRVGMIGDEQMRDDITMDLATMERFIGSALAYIRNGANESPRPVDMVSLITTVIDGAAEKGLAVSYSGPPRMILSIRPTAFQRALENIADNSAKYAGRMDVRLTIVRDGGAMITFDDDGPGIPPADRPAALMPFRRLFRPVDSFVEGSGLGLALAHRAAMAEHGTLELYSSSSGGLSVVINIPSTASCA